VAVSCVHVQACANTAQVLHALKHLLGPGWQFRYLQFGSFFLFSSGANTFGQWACFARRRYGLSCGRLVIHAPCDQRGRGTGLEMQETRMQGGEQRGFRLAWLCFLVTCCHTTSSYLDELLFKQLKFR
jgi:hypothetical protein